MRKEFIALPLVALLFAGPVNADESAVKELDKSSPKIAESTTKDAASGLPTGKRQHKPVSVTKPVDKATPVAPRDHASGMASGKRGHKPVTITKPVDKATPLMHRTSDDDKDVAKKTNKSEAARARRPD